MISMDFKLDRFLSAQTECYLDALNELQAGEKKNHWMWYIFPQLKGLGSSSTATYYGISGLEEAQAYLGNGTLRMRLIESTEAVLGIEHRSLREIFGDPDNYKFRSSMTLFEAVNPKIECFASCLEKYYNGRRDLETLRLLDSGGL
jgi:uncharacterized protein (DUF1810 family)